MMIGDLDIQMNSVGTFVGNAYKCETTIVFFGLAIGTTVVATPDSVWLDSGLGLEQTTPFNDDVDSATSICLANPEFWEGYEQLPFDGEPDTINGIATQRVVLTDFLDILSALGIDLVSEGMELEEATAWFADPEGWLAGLDMTMIVDSAEISGAFGIPAEGAEDARMSISMRIANPNDPNLIVPVPADDGTGVLFGRLEVDGLPLAGVEVFLGITVSGIRARRFTCTDATGTFVFSGVPLDSPLISFTGPSAERNCDNYLFVDPDASPSHPLAITQVLRADQGIRGDRNLGVLAVPRLPGTPELAEATLAVLSTCFDGNLVAARVHFETYKRLIGELSAAGSLTAQEVSVLEGEKGSLQFTLDGGCP